MKPRFCKKCGNEIEEDVPLYYLLCKKCRKEHEESKIEQEPSSRYYGQEKKRKFPKLGLGHGRK